ncbi:MAG TPA: hypothetical protein PLU30_01325 [Verrucomicrobiae bacterium]|nr:hypothetical protein [Verrucomicrobiae bacterium]
MKRRSRGFGFLGFVALADMIFAVSAGLLLLNPIRPDEMEEDEAEKVPDLSALHRMINAAEQQVSEVESLAKTTKEAVQNTLSETKQ